jgi:hypothetical protein
MTKQYLLYAFFWVIPRHLNIVCQRFGTLCSIFIGAYEDGTDRVCRNVVNKIQMPRNHPEESVEHSEHGKSLKPRKILLV